jgi:hypothetical protein
MIIAALFGFTSCGKPSQADQQIALEVVRRNVQAMQSGNVEEVLKTVHPQSPGYAQTRQVLEDLFKRFQLSCELEELTVESVSREGVRAGFVQVTDKVSGDDGFQKNRLRGTHMLKKDGATWKLWQTEVGEMEPL